MLDPNFLILYVADPVLSAKFYTKLLGKEPVEVSPTFALFALDTEVRFGLWSKYTAAPLPRFKGSSGELAFCVANDNEVDGMYREWMTHPLPILQRPTRMDFGYTFVAADPDGHRLRVF